MNSEKVRVGVIHFHPGTPTWKIRARAGPRAEAAGGACPSVRPSGDRTLDWLDRQIRKWCRLKALSERFLTTPRSSKTDTISETYGTIKLRSPVLFLQLRGGQISDPVYFLCFLDDAFFNIFNLLPKGRDFIFLCINIFLDVRR